MTREDFIAEFILSAAKKETDYLIEAAAKGDQAKVGTFTSQANLAGTMMANKLDDLDLFDDDVYEDGEDCDCEDGCEKCEGE